MYESPLSSVVRRLCRPGKGSAFLARDAVAVAREAAVQTRAGAVAARTADVARPGSLFLDSALARLVPVAGLLLVLWLLIGWSTGWLAAVAP